jgi:hypothetical protein
MILLKSIIFTLALIYTLKLITIILAALSFKQKLDILFLPLLSSILWGVFYYLCQIT